MARLRKAHRITLAIVGIVSVIAIIAVLVLTQTDWGRRRVLAIGLGQLTSRVHGQVKIGRLHGNLLVGARLADVVIADTAGRPFLNADTLELRYSLRSLLRKHLVLSDVRVVNGVMVLDQPPGEEWNYARIFPLSPEPGRGPGFGSWVLINNMTVRNLTAVVRAEWAPDDTLTGAARQRAIAAALSPTGRKWIVPVGRGYQSISQFFGINGRFPLMRLADADSANRLIAMSGLTMIALPFRPPAAQIKSLSARLLITKDTLFVDSVRVGLPGTRVSGTGAYALDGGGARVQLTLPEAASADARFLMPDAPAGRGSLQLAATTRGNRAHVIASNMDLHVEGATVRGLADVQLGGGTFLVGPSDVAYANVDTRLVRRYMPSAPLNVPGMLSGHMRLSGTPENMSVDGRATYAEARGPVSRIVADGRIGTSGGVLTARGLRLRFEPLQMTLAKAQMPAIPYGGTITGTTTLTGSTRSGFALIADLVHRSSAVGRSHVTANGRVTLAGGPAAHDLRLGLQPVQVAALRPFMNNLPIDGTLVGSTTVNGAPGNKTIAAVLNVEHRSSTGRSRFVGRANANWAGRGFVDIDVRAPVLSLATVGKVAPQAGLHGAGSGRIVARGSLARLNADANLALADDQGTLATRGVFNLKAARKQYDFTSTFNSFNVAAATARLPTSLLTGTVVVRGAGTAPANANATVRANLTGSRAAAGPLLDTTIVHARLANGLAVIDTGQIRLASTRADFAGDFGLIASRSGTLRYALAVDTLAHLSDRIRTDTGFVRPRPLVQARRLAQARADSARIAQRTAVQRVATGHPAAPELSPDTLPMRRDTVGGSLYAEGTLTGNIKRFDARGTAKAHNLTVGANHVGAGAASYTVTGFGSPDAAVHVEVAGDTVHVDGFVFDSARAKLDYTGVRNRGRGTVDVAMYQDLQRDYAVRSDFDVALDRKQAVLQTLTLRFDTTRWESTRQANIGWGKAGTTVENLELRSNAGGYMRADGRLPTSGSADLTLDVERLQLGDLTVLLQDTSSIQGLLDLHARVTGTGSDPAITGNLALVEAAYRGKQLPDVRSTLTYANADLTTRTELHRESTLLALVDAHVPVNLAISGVSGPRLQRNAPIQIDARADSLPLEALPSFTDAVSDVRGRVRGNATVRGTIDAPDIDGIALLDLGSLRVGASGVLYNDVVGTMRLRGDTVYLDSIVAHSGGTVRTAGKLSLETLTRPGFDLTVVADNARLLDNEKGRIRADANLTVQGPYDGVHVRGDVNIKGGVVYAPETQNQRVTNLDDPTLRTTLDTAGLGLVLPPPNPLLQNLRVDVTVNIEPDTWARNTQLNVEVFTPPGADPLTIHMDNAHHVLTLDGVIHADHGEYSVAGRSLQLSTGSATFLGGPTMDPLIELTARYQVQRRGQEALIIEVHVDGNLTQPRVTLQSNSQPPLSQSDLLAYLAFGQPASSLTSSQSTGAAVGNGGLSGLPALAQQQIASLAVGASVDQAVAGIERRGTGAGLDVFRVHAGELPAEAAFEGYFQNIVRGTEIEAGKYVADRFFVAARGRTSTYPGLSVEYRTPIGLTWRGTWEPRYLPVEPSLATPENAAQVRSLGLFLLWSRRF